ncbi:hypothetical protein [Phaeobacter inhibens]|uniref:hypothetical protein n=1 Tax=Phaeobacter inhibens TaxID=221822 RepID=UPI00076BB5CE|nr:hypothetical protein [Phaeobacter inhibens]KXF92081.1 hypothetical protein AT574_03750 [Phaeobacter inhibens]WHP69914.1 hypothetical protein QMZ01_07000 [Phaeobacter inhibens]
MSLELVAQALNSKIQTAADGAGPEDLAMLATALDRIGGRVTIAEVMAAGVEAKMQLTQAQAEAIAAIVAVKDDVRQAALEFQDTALKSTQFFGLFVASQ